MVDLVIVGIYLVSVLVVGFYYSFKVKSASEYAVAGRDYPVPIIVATIFATLIGGASTIGVAEQFFSVGIIFFVVCLGAAIRDLISAQWIIPRMGDLSGLVSAGDFMAQYTGKPGRLITGFAVLARCVGFIGTQISALGFLGNYFLGIPYTMSAIIAGGIVIFYSSFGGIRSVTITDVIQFGVLLVAIPMVANFGINAVGGFHTLSESLPASHTTFFVETPALIKYCGLALVFLIPDLDPAIIQRVMMGRNLEQGRLSLLISSFASIPIYALVGLIGLVSLAIAPNLEANLAFPFLLNNAIPAGARGIAISGILAVVMSTADSYLNIGGIALIHDIVKPLSKSSISDKNELRFMQFGTMLLGVFAIAFALVLPNVFALAIASLMIWQPVISPPMLMGMLGLLKSQKIFYTGILSSLLILIVWNTCFKSSSGIDGILVATFFHFIILIFPILIAKFNNLNFRSKIISG